MRLFLRIILKHWCKPDVFLFKEKSNVLQISRHGIIGGERYKKRTRAAQMSFCRHRYGSVGDSGSKFCKGISGAGANNQRFKRELRTKRLGVLNTCRFAFRQIPTALHLVSGNIILYYTKKCNRLSVILLNIGLLQHNIHV